MEDKDKYITLAKAARIKECSRSSIYNLVKRGKINSYEFAGKPFVIQDEVFQQVQITRGMGISKLEEKIAALEERIKGLEEENNKLKERVSQLEGKREVTKRRG